MPVDAVVVFPIMSQSSDSTASSVPAEAKTPAPVVKRVRRISSKPVKDTAVSKAPAEATPSPTPAPAHPAETPKHRSTETLVTPAPAQPAERSASVEPKPAPWTEPEVSEGSSAGESAAKRKRKRRRKGKGGTSPNSGNASFPESPSEADGSSPSMRSAELPAEAARDSSAPPKSHAPRVSFDPTAVSKMAWKLYQGEIGEEGIALIDDHDARDLVRRCFRLAEIFLDEQARRGR
jgi:hypothetical protein